MCLPACGSSPKHALEKTTTSLVAGHAGAPTGYVVRQWHLVAGRNVAFGDYDADELKSGRVDHDDDDLAGPLDRDGDRDAKGSAYLDGDDRGAGIPLTASKGDVRAMRVLVRRYFSAARRADGGAACALMLPALARSLPRESGVLPYARAKTCRAVMSKFLAVNRRQLAGEAGALEAVHGRVRGNEGWVLLAFHGIATRGFAVRRYKQAWRFSVTITDQELP